MASTNADAWHPGTAMRFAVRRRSRCARASSAGAKRGARVDQHSAVVLDERRRFARRNVRQTQEGDVRSVDETTALVDILTLRFFDAEDFNVCALRQVFENLQAGRAFLSVDKNFRAHLDLAG
jgi:hypothetical protein